MHALNDKHVIGCSMEYRVASWLIDMGYTIYWPAIQQSRHDLLVENMHGKFLKVQIKKATWNKVGNSRYLQCRLKKDERKKQSNYSLEDYELLAVTDGERFWLIPHEDILNKTCIHLDKVALRPNKTKRDYDPEKWRIL